MITPVAIPTDKLPNPAERGVFCTFFSVARGILLH